MRVMLCMALAMTSNMALAGELQQPPHLEADGLPAGEPRPGDVIGFDPETGEPIYLGGPQAVPGSKVYRGTRSVAGEFPTSGWIGNCTANAVALDVVLTAGHCKATGARINFQHRESGQTYTATCTRHPRYNSRTIYNDWTLCKLDRPLPAGSKLVTISSARPAIGTEVWVNGYGAPNVGTHYWGTSSVRRFDGQDIVTCGPSTLGGGDSGGTLMVKGADRTLPEGADGLGVNSRGNGSCDWYNDYSHSEFQTWAREYEQEKNVQLCGISANCKEPPTPIDCAALYDELAACVRDDSPVTMPADGTTETCLQKYEKFRQCIRP